MPSQSLTIWIQTCNRPHFLKTALESVRRQTARAAITSIILVENGADRRSEALCRAFPDLPIRYVFRDPPLAPGCIQSVEAAEKMIRDCDTDLLAVLFDDDWWAPNHLERALAGLREVPGAVASFSLYLHTGGEARYISHISENFVLWLATRGRPRGDWWVLSPADLVVSSLLASTLHYSTMVVNRTLFADAMAVLKIGNPYDTDRVIGVELGYHGKVLCDSLPSAFVRWHENNEWARLQKSGEGQQWWDRSTAEIVARAQSHGIDVAHEFAESMRATGTTINDLQRHGHPGAVDYLVRNHIVAPARAASGGELLKNLMPPLIWKILGRMRRRTLGA
jgi:hypothetical protein